MNMQNILYLKSKKANIAESPTLDSFDEAKKIFLLNCRAKNLSPQTLGWYNRKLNELEKFLQCSELQAVTPQTITRFICHLQEKQNLRYRGKGLSSYTIAGTVRALRVFFHFLHDEGYLPVNPCEKIKVPKIQKKIIIPLTGEEIQRLLSVPDKKTFTGFRDYLAMLIFLDTAMRLSELLGLKIHDVDLENRTLKVLGKGAIERTVPFGFNAAKTFIKYLKWRGDKPGHDFVFINKHGSPLSGRQLHENVQRHGRAAGIERLHPHRFRHTAALNWIKAGGDVLSLQKLLGHADLTMVRNYVNLAADDVAEKHKQYGLIDRLIFSEGRKKHDKTF